MRSVMTVLASAGLVTVVTLGVAGSASAAECAAPYTTDDLLADLAAVEAAAQGGEQGPALKTATRMENGLGCLEEKLVPMLIGRTYRSIGAGYVVGGNEERGVQWFRTAIELDSGYSFGLEEFSYESPVRSLYESLKMSASDDAVAVEGGLASGEFFLDGRLLTAPEATPERPHLLQRQDGTVSSWIIEGNAFPAEVVVAAAVADAGDGDGGKPEKVKKPKKVKPPKAPKEPKEPKESRQAKNDGDGQGSSDGTTRTVAVRPPEKTPLMIGGAAVVVGAGALYTGAILARQDFNGITDSEDSLRKAQNQTNMLYFASIGTFVVGAGTLGWGLALPSGK